MAPDDVLELTADMQVPSPQPVWGWERMIAPPFLGGHAHVVPLLDVGTHDFNPPCPCGAHWDDEGDQVIHHAFDQRELYEFHGKPRH